MAADRAFSMLNSNEKLFVDDPYSWDGEVVMIRCQGCRL